MRDNLPARVSSPLRLLLATMMSLIFCNVLALNQAGSGALDGATRQVLERLPANTALDLGVYDCEPRVPGLSCASVTAYSRFNYDPHNHRLLLFGGGHAATGRTDIDAFDIETLSWSSLYPSMTCEQVMENDLDPRGFHRKTGHPVARHTYDMSVIGQLDDVPHLFLLSNEGLRGKCHSYKATIEGVAAFPLIGQAPKWVYSRQFRFPWSYAAAAEYDPVSKKIIIMGKGRGSSPSKAWVYDPNDGSVIAIRIGRGIGSYDHNLVYFPPSDAFYLITRAKPTVVYEIKLDRSNWNKSSSVRLTTTGDVPSVGRTGYAYDSKNEVIGGGIDDGKFRVFDPRSRSWDAVPMQVKSNDVRTAPRSISHVLDYAPRSNVYFFMTREDSTRRRTWAYRYR